MFPIGFLFMVVSDVRAWEFRKKYYGLSMEPFPVFRRVCMMNCKSSLYRGIFMYKKLRKILINAQRNVEFYKGFINTSLISGGDDEVIQVFSELPIVDKQLIRQNFNLFIHNDIVKSIIFDNIINLNKDYYKEYTYQLPFASITCEFTSGSSGIPFLTIKSNQERIILGKKLWQLRNSFSPIDSKDFFNAFHSAQGNRYPFPFEPEDNEYNRTEKEIEFLQNSSYKWWYSSNYRLNMYCEFLKSQDVTFNNLEVIENNGSFLSDEERNSYMKVFKCRVANNYGCKELWTIAYDCVYGYLHLNDEYVLFELVDEDGKIINGSNIIGRVVITSLNLEYMPIIRYFLGDYAYYLSGICPCGCNSKRIALVPGRHMIEGTNLYGNQVFRRIIQGMNLDYQITNYFSICIKQVDFETMFVNIKGNRENKNKIEAAFIFESKKMLGDKFKYYFIYSDEIDSKDLFVSTSTTFS
jgi:phenylacetate-CoA ligase